MFEANDETIPSEEERKLEQGKLNRARKIEELLESDQPLPPGIEEKLYQYHQLGIKQAIAVARLIDLDQQRAEVYESLVEDLTTLGAGIATQAFARAVHDKRPSVLRFIDRFRH